MSKHYLLSSLHAPTIAVVIVALSVFALTSEAQVLSDNPTYYAWAPAGAMVDTVIREHEVGVDFQTNGQSGVYFNVENDAPVDGTTGEDLILNYSIDVQTPWISIGIRDNNGRWYFHRAVDVATGDQSVTIPVSELPISATTIKAYAVWISAVDYSGTRHDLDGSFRFQLGGSSDSSIHIRAGDEAMFLATMRTPNNGEPGVFYIHDDAVLDNRLDIVGRSGDELHFLDGVQITSQVQSEGDWSDSRGVVNVVGCNNLLITGLRATNNFMFGTAVNGDNQSSTALNISRSTDIRFEGADLKCLGKSAVWIHGGSTVNMSDTTIDAYYFCVGVGASTVSFSNLTTNQLNPLVTADRHSVFWVSSAMRAEINNQLYRNTAITLFDATMNLRTGRAIVSGNGGYESHSNIFFFGTTDVNATDYSFGKALGWANFHSNYHGYTINVTGDYPSPTRDLVQPTDDGEFGRFIVNTFQGGGRPSAFNPISFCEGAENCVTSDEVLGTNQPVDLVQGGLNDEWSAINPTQLSTTASGNLRAAYSAAYEAVILNKEIRKIDMTQATRLRIRSKVQQQGTFTFRVSFVNEANRLLNPESFTLTGGNDWQTNTFQLSDTVRQAADKIIIGSFGNTQDATIELAEMTIQAD